MAELIDRQMVCDTCMIRKGSRGCYSCIVYDAPTIDPESLRKKGEWISVEDRLPEEKINCIVHYRHAYCENDEYWAIGISFFDGVKFQMDRTYKVTHWMPLPQPTKGE